MALELEDLDSSYNLGEFYLFVIIVKILHLRINL